MIMKKAILAFLLVSGLTLGVRAQDEKKKEISSQDVPEEVMKSFNSTFANATDVEWKKKNNEYKVSFDMNGIEHHAMFNSSGTVTSQGHEISESDLPAAVATALKKDYPNHRIDEVHTMIKDGDNTYKVSLDGSPDKKVIYSPDGKMIKEKKKD